MDYADTGKGVCIPGFKAWGVREGKTGVALIVSDVLCESAGVFTQNSVKAAPVILTRDRIKNGLNAVVINSGNANACVKGGLEDAEKMCETTARILGIEEKHVSVSSTGIIGVRLKLGEIQELVKKTSEKLVCSNEGGLEAAKAIMTTDTRPKMFSVEYDGIEVGGIAKGAGMIAPNMATMLCFITTNAKLGGGDLQSALGDSVDKSFNMLVVDGDTSTNDTVLLLSNGGRECDVKVFRALLDCVTETLAKKLALDAEGASKYLEVSVVNAEDDESARKAVKAVLSSPLVKTALYGQNPNWGRILCKLGSVVYVDFTKTSILFSDGKIEAYAIQNGRAGDRGKVAEILKSEKIIIKVDLKSGGASARGFGCDLSPEYVKINAEYN